MKDIVSANEEGMIWMEKAFEVESGRYYLDAVKVEIR
jgi:hypothetical protein